MNDSRKRICGLPAGPFFVRLGALLLLIAPLPRGATGVERERPLPEFPVIRAVVLRELVHPPKRAPDDMIARSEVEPVFDQLRLMGWVVRDRKAILKRLPRDTDFVLQRLRTDNGRRFMRKVSKFPLGYDRLYRLASLPGGRQLVVDLINDKGGSQLIAYLTGSQGGRNLGKMLKGVPNGADFNQPTGRIFTTEQLITRLRESLIAEQERRDAAGRADSAAGR
jgi:hypothetical protein